MPKVNDYELGILSAYEKGKLKSVATKAELAKLKAAARATPKQLKTMVPLRTLRGRPKSPNK